MAREQTGINGRAAIRKRSRHGDERSLIKDLRGLSTSGTNEQGNK